MLALDRRACERGTGQMWLFMICTGTWIIGFKQLRLLLSFQLAHWVVFSALNVDLQRSLRKWPLTPTLQLLIWVRMHILTKGEGTAYLYSPVWSKKVNEGKTNPKLSVNAEWTRTVTHCWQTFAVCMSVCGCWSFHFTALWLQPWFVSKTNAEITFFKINALSYLRWGKNQFLWTWKKLPHHPHLHTRFSHPQVFCLPCSNHPFKLYKFLLGNKW